MRTLGIDPGSSRIGFAYLDRKGSVFTVGEVGTIEIKSGSPSEKMLELRDRLRDILQKSKPNQVVVERLFFSKNKKTAMSVAESRGVILLTIKEEGLPLIEVTPNQMKSLITGDGGADKKGVRKMVSLSLGIPTVRGHDDATDALALALAGAYLGIRG